MYILTRLEPIAYQIKPKPQRMIRIRTKAENIALKLAKINPTIRTLITEFELTDNNGQLINI